MDEVYTEDTGLYEDSPAEPTKDLPWSKGAASSFAGKLALAANNYDADAIAKMKEELMGTGRSSTADSLANKVQEQKRLAIVEASADIVPELGAETAFAAMEARLSQPSNVVDDIDEAAAMEAVSAAKYELSPETFNAMMDEEQRIAREYSKIRQEDEFFSGGVLKGVTDFVGTFAPFNEANSWRRLITKLEDEFGADFGTEAGTYFAQGEYSTVVRDWFDEQSPEEQVDTLRYLTDVLPDVAGYFGNNDFIKASMLGTIVERAEQGVDPIDTTRVVDDVLSILEVVGVGSGVKSLYKSVKSGKHIKDATANAAMLERTNPEASSKAEAHVVVTGSEDAAEELGTSVEEVIADQLLPKWKDYEASPHISAKTMEEQMDAVARVVKRESDVDLHLTEAEKTLQVENLHTTLGAAKGGALWENASSVAKTDTGVKVVARYGKDDVAGFASKEEAEAFLDGLQRRMPAAKGSVVEKAYDGTTSAAKGRVEAPVEPKKHPTVTKAIEDVKAKLKAEASPKPVKGKLEVSETAKKKAATAKQNLAYIKAGEYDKLTGKAKAAYKTALSTVEREAQKASSAAPKQWFVDLDYTDSFKIDKSNVMVSMDDILWAGDKAAWMADISAGLAKHLSDSFYRAFDASRGFEKDLITILKPFLGASTANKKRILSLLDEGSVYKNADGTVGKNFTVDEVLQRMPENISSKDAQQVIEGYVAVRQMADVSHFVMNKSMRNELVAEGYKHIKAGDRNILGTKVGDDNWPTVAYDPETKTAITLSKAEREARRAQGYVVYASKEAIGDGNNLYSYVLVGGKTTVSELPSEVLNYRPGYIPRIYKDQYFVTVAPKRTRINGVLVPDSEAPVKVIGVAKNRADALRQVDKIRDENPELLVDWKHDRRLTTGQAREAELSLQLNTGGMFYSRRGNHLAREGGQLAEIENPVSAISQMAASIARKAQIHPVIQLHKQRWLSQFGHITRGKYPLSKAVIVKEGRVSDPEVAKARAYWDYIDVQESTASTSPMWRSAMFRFSEWIEDKTGKEQFGSFFRTSVAEKDPFQMARGATFLATIVLNPFRQFFIQSQQILFLAGIDPKGIASGDVLRAGVGLMWHNGENTAKAAKFAGMSEDELVKLSEAYRASGLVEAVDSHLIGRDALMSIDAEVRTGRLARAAQTGANAAKKATNAVRRVGFDAGELINISQTYVVAYRRWKKANPGKDAFSRQAQYDIAADTRQLALGMTNAGAYKYQRGVLSLPTQFLSVQHKAIASMIGQNKALTKAEAKRIALGQVFVYGATGIGIGAAVDWAMEKAGVEVNPQVRNILIGGMYDLVANNLVHNTLDNNYTFADNLAAGGGWANTFTDKLSDFHNTTALELFMGPSATMFSRFGNAFSITGSILGARVLGEKEELTASDAAEMFNSWASIASLYNNVKKGYAMYQSGSMVGKYLEATGVPADYKDSLIKGMFGVGTYEEASFYDHVTTASEKKKWMQKVADTYYGRVTERFNLWETQGSLPSIDRIIAANRNERELLNFMYGEQDATQIMILVEELIKQRADKGNGVLVEQVAKASTQGTYGDSADEIVTNLVNGGLVKPEDASALRKMNDYLWKVE